MDRARDTLPQFASARRWSWPRLEQAVWLLLFGTIKYTVTFLFGDASDRLMDLNTSGGLSLLLGCWVYTLRFWLLFSGTVDLSRGLSRAFGVEIARNFDAPMLATNIADFWRRWNIAFTSWLYEEVFSRISFQLRKFGNYGTAAACLGTFLLSGIAHGLDWSVVTWTTIQGGSIFIYFVYRNKIRKWAKRRGNPRWFTFAGWLLTVHLFVVPLGLGSFGDPSKVAFGFWKLVRGPFWTYHGSQNDLWRCLLTCVVAFGLHSLPKVCKCQDRLNEQRGPIRVIVGVSTCIAIFLIFGYG